tara:strand:- start:26 stop:886 length:861 start_codon:yes stop_codon:yes gene_type:complete
MKLHTQQNTASSSKYRGASYRENDTTPSTSPSTFIDNRPTQSIQLALASKPIQRQIIQSPGYKLEEKRTENGWTNQQAQKIWNGWERLDEATRIVKGKVDKSINSGKMPKTKHWEAFVKNQSASNYGYLVEEGVNEYARNAGWATQVKLEGARPDYGRKLGGKYAMADLTTTRESNGAGMHLAGKLNKSNWKGKEFVAAADITYDRNGENQIPIIPSRQDAIAKYDEIMKERDEDDYNPATQYLQQRIPQLPNKTESDPEVWQTWLDELEELKNNYDPNAEYMEFD